MTIPRLPKPIASPVAVGSDTGFVMNTGHGHGFHKPLSIADGLASGATLVREAGEAAGKVAPAVSKAIANASATPAGAATGTAIGGLAKAAPYLWAGNMALQGVDVAMNPEANKQATLQMADQGAGARAWYGLNNPIKTIAGTGQVLGDLASTTYQNYQDAKKFDQLDAFRNSNPQEAGPVGIGRAIGAAFQNEGGVRGSSSIGNTNDPYVRAAIDFLSRVPADKVRSTLETGGPRSNPMGVVYESGQTPQGIVDQINRLADRSSPTAAPSQLAIPTRDDYRRARQ